MDRRVVVTGIGVVTPVGIGREACWKSLVDGASGVAPVTLFETGSFPVRVAAEVKDFKASLYIKQRKSLKVMARDIKLAVAASQLAIWDADLDLDKTDRRRVGVNMGAGLINADIHELALALNASMVNGVFSMQRFGATGMNQLFPLWLLKYLPNMLACHTSIIFDCQGPNNTLTTGNTGSSQAIGEAFRIIQRGSADVFLCGGSDSKVHPLSLVRFVLLGNVAQVDGDPTKVSRPFDRDRCGFVVGEGAGVVVLEELEHARRRGAHVYAEVLGYGCTNHGLNPECVDGEGTGVAEAMKMALRCASVGPEHVDYINANGMSTVEDDRAETKAIKRVCGERACKIPVSSIKSMIGNLSAAAGAVEFASTVLSVHEDVLPPTINYENPDPECDLDYVPNVARRIKVRVALTNNFGYGGQCTTLAVGKLRD